MDKNKTGKSIGVAVTSLLILGGISQQQVYANTNEVNKSIVNISKSNGESKNEKWIAVKTLPEIKNCDIGKFYTDHEKYRFSFNLAMYSEVMKDYMKNISEISVNNVLHKKTYEITEDNQYGYNSFGLEISKNSFAKEENILIIKSKGYNTTKVRVKKDGTILEQLEQEEIPNIVNTGNVSTTGGTAPENNIKPQKNKDKAKDSEKNTDKDTSVSSNNKIKVTKDLPDGTYTIGFKSYKVENEKESSMLGGFFDKNIKLEVKDGKIKLTLLHTTMANLLLDLRMESNGLYPESKLNYYKNTDMKTVEMEVSDLTKPHLCAVLVTAMGGRQMDIGDISKYKVAKIVFDTEVSKGWNEFKASAEKNKSNELTKLLVDKGFDTNSDGEVTDEEIKNYPYDTIELNDSKLKNISRLKNLGKNIKFLNLSCNKIEKLDQELFKNMINLETLYLQANEIKELPSGLFDSLTKLKELKLSTNKLTTLPEGIFDNLTSLEELDLDKNKLNFLPKDIFKNLTSLKNIGMNENNLTEIPEDFKYLKSLEGIYMASNSIEKIPAFLSKLPNLKRIYISNNLIYDVSDEFFNNIKNIKVLNVKDNLITKVPNNIKDLLSESSSNNLMLNNLKTIPDFSEDEVKDLYPQKNITDLTLKAENGNISWTQKLSLVDLICWTRANQIYTQDIRNVEEYKAYLNGRTPKEILDSQGYMWNVVTQIQRKDENGKYITIETIEDYSKEDSDGLFRDEDMKKGTEYRIVKRLYGSDAEPFIIEISHIANAVATSNTVIHKPSVNSQQGTVDVKILKENNDDNSMSGVYFGREDNADGTIKKEAKVLYIKRDGKNYIQVKSLAIDWMREININVDGKKVQPVIKEIGDTTVMGMNHKGATIEFEVPSLDSKIVFNMFVVPMNSNVAFRMVPVKSQLSAKPEETNIAEKPNVKPEVPKDTEKFIIKKEKPAVYEAKVVLAEANKGNEKAIKKYVDVDQKINVEVKDKQEYMTIKLKGKQQNIKRIKVDGKVSEFQVVGEEVGKVNRFAVSNEAINPKAEKNEESTTVRFKIPNEKVNVEIIMHDEAENKDVSFAIKLKEDTIKEVKDGSKPVVKPINITSSTSHNHHKHKKHRKESKEDDTVRPSEQVKDDKKDDTIVSKDTNIKEDGNNDAKPNNDAKDNNKKDDNLKDNKDTKKDKEDKKGNNASEKKEPNDIKNNKNVQSEKDVSKEVKTENKKDQKQNKVTSKEKLGSTKKVESKSNKKATEIKEKKLPQTGMPFGSGLLATIGSTLSGLGVVLMRKNRKNKK
ncbi:NEAT domain-containing protein [Clostridium botulinum]|uniref:NEAT domain-containing protein n=1 Tax=Clostridium botulinum TaxID=1491 RepID=UPI0004D49D36|nr:NEAT domain-containing protein [Clostridium botulinum]KEI07486.1 hypothetical protein Z952_03965 [Clostridium botulinum C/D str. BKT75002]KEI09854.1 hypothetical protein Z954_11315 [Clostridium botulinum C/D str. BKT2873]QPW60084.1 NEAT domain-containing protein [Clostridium botulinum]